jgi:hypothetical protein
VTAEDSPAFVHRSGQADETYAEVWPPATPDERRTMLVDAGVLLEITSPREWALYVDYDKVLGHGPSGQELYDQLNVTRRSSQRGIGYLTSTLSGLASKALGGGGTTINVNSVDEAMAAKQTEQNKKSLSYAGR